MGSSNVLLHLKHHHPKEHVTIVQQLARKKPKSHPEPNNQPLPGNKMTINTIIKTELPDPDTDQGNPVNIKVEVEET